MASLPLNQPQRLLALQVSVEVTLVTVDVARAVLGCDSESVSARVDCGQLIWVWDVAAPGANHRRELRFWTAELRSLPEGRQTADPQKVISQVIGNTPEGRQRSALLEVRFSMSPQHVRTLCDAGELDGPIAGHTRYISRASLEGFLLRRLVR
ncbi:MAG: hypothetical protein J0M24_13915 [Verrucomicrobia bacterium]|nr:hypothetical protein [Verrucomicrobiota bacterium]